MRQYRDGKRFADAVVEAGGIELLNRAWGGPEALPDARLRSPTPDALDRAPGRHDQQLPRPRSAIPKRFTGVL